MNKKGFGRWLSTRGTLAVMDGGMGSLLAEQGWNPPDLPEEMNLKSPEMVSSIHRAYIDAGASVIETNTFGGSSRKLALRGLEARTFEINRTAAGIARSVSSGKALVAGSVGPLGELLEPFGPLVFEEALEAFRPQISGLAAGGVDFILIETMMDLREAMAAVLAAKDSAPGLAFAVSFTFDTHGRTVTGTTPEAAAHWARSIGACAVGANCGTGPDEYLKVVEALSGSSGIPVLVYPNAGVPGRSDYWGPESFSKAAEGLAKAGASAIGGCCGTTPAHIRLVAGTVGHLPLPAASIPEGTFLSGRGRVITAGPGKPVLIVGERINVSRKSPLRDEIAAGNLEILRGEAVSQASAGASAIDLNLGLPGIDQARAVSEAAVVIQQAVDVPLSLDSDSLDVIEAGMLSTAGIPLINSVTAKKRDLYRGLELASRFGACLTVLLMDEEGIPETAKGRISILEKVLSSAEESGFPLSSLFVDALTLAVGAVEGGPSATLETIREISEKGARSILGVSNVSHGLPARSLINRSFLAMAMSAGLDAVIMDPLDRQMMEAVAASEALTGRDPGIRRYISSVKDSPADVSVTSSLSGKATTRPPLDRIREGIISGDVGPVLKAAEEMTSKGGASPLDIIGKGVVPALEKVGQLFEGGEFFLPQLLASAGVAKKVCDFARGLMGTGKGSASGIIVLATVEGDLHDLGKNVVGTIFQSHGYDVVDLGRDVPADRIIEAVSEVSPDVIGLSALMTTTMPAMGHVIRALEEAGMDVPVIVGGACVNGEFADSVGAAGYAADAVSAVGLVARLLAERRGNG